MDQISNMIITMKNGAMISKKSVTVPFSAVKMSIAQCLKDHGFIESYSKKTEKNNVPVIEIELAYPSGISKISDVKRISKPSRRVYMGVRDIHIVKNNRGITVFSTPKGILSNKQAHKEQVGGEALFMIW
ncbi:MAG: 30S ribosomal protein S8 [Candidatus Pacebacteria bacterium]|nr:30S ribosomal protein S8 [Candidatus Paceibacterota bacterium]